MDKEKNKEQRSGYFKGIKWSSQYKVHIQD
jgi:hypothetical protein